MIIPLKRNIEFKMPVELIWRETIFETDLIKINLNHEQDFHNMGF